MWAVWYESPWEGLYFKYRKCTMVPDGEVLSLEATHKLKRQISGACTLLQMSFGIWRIE